MPTFEQILKAHDDGELTRNGFFIYTLSVLASVQPETVERALRRRPADLDAFMEWVDDVLAGAELFFPSDTVPITDENRAAIERFRAYMRGASGACPAIRQLSGRPIP